MGSYNGARAEGGGEGEGGWGRLCHGSIRSYSEYNWRWPSLNPVQSFPELYP